MQQNRLIRTMIVAFVVSIALLQITARAAPSNAEQNLDITEGQQQVAVRTISTLPTLLDFMDYKRLFNKSYSSISENMVRFKLFTARALRTFVSAIKYRYRQVSYHLALNHMSDASQEELNMMRNRLLEAENDETREDVAPTGSRQNQLPNIILDDDDADTLNELRQMINEHRDEPGFDELRAQLEQFETAAGARDESEVNKHDSCSTLAVAPRELSPEKLVSMPAANNKSDTEILDDVKILVQPESNNPEYRGPNLTASIAPVGLVEQLTDLPTLELGTRDEIIDSITRILKDLTLKYIVCNIEEVAPQEHLPDEVFLDLRKESSCFFPARNQGNCGSCYAFASIAVAEWLHCKTTGELVPFSEQYVIDCGTAFTNGEIQGCSGGYLQQLSKFFHNFGFELRHNFPYLEREGQCPYHANTDLRTVGYIRGDLRKSVSFYMGMWPEALKRHGPLMIMINSGSNLPEYGSGVYDDCKPMDSDHVVVLIGHGRENGQEYWLIRNSYSARWGEAGHIKLSKKAECIWPRFGYTFGSDDGKELTMKMAVNEANDGAVKAKYSKQQV